jgi:hypothetical protein
MRFASFAAAVFFGFWALLAGAEEVGRPDIKVGDSWTYQFKDGLTGELKGTASFTVYEVTDTQIHQKAQIKLKVPVNRVEVVDRQLNLLDNSVYQWKPSTGYFKFPLKVGNQWTQQYEATAISNKSKTRHEIASKVVAFEKIKVPAGVFDTFKIEYTIRNMATRDAGRADSYTKGTRWYAPKVKQTVKQVSEIVMAGHVKEKSEILLTEFSSQPTH